MEHVERLRRVLDTGKSLRLKEVEDLLGLQERQVRRIVKKLEALVPLVKGKQNGEKTIAIAPQHQRQILEGVPLSEEEMVALMVAGLAAQTALGETPLGQPLADALGKVQKAQQHRFFEYDLVHEPNLWHFDNIVVSVIDPEVFTRLHRAMSNQRTVHIAYHSASSNTSYRDRKIDPYLFAYQGSSWLVIGYCHLRKAFRDFAVAGISDVREAETCFSIKPTFDASQHLRDRFNALAGNGAFVVRLWIAKDRASYFNRKQYHPTQQIEETLEDGSIIVSFEAINLEDVRAFTQSWGIGARAIEPPELVARLRAEAEELAARYSAPP